MKRQNKILTLTMALAMVATETYAQSLWGNDPYGRNNRGFALDMAVIRILMMVISTAMGFALGWFLSPQAKEWRKILYLLVGGIAFMVAVSSNGALGWSTTWLISFVGFWLALGYWFGKSIKSLGEVPSTFGSSRWATPDDLKNKKIFNTDAIRLGMAFNGEIDQTISYASDGHLRTVAPTRAGKGTTQIINNLLTYEGSVLVIDPKGENTLITAQARQDMGQKVLPLDPWGIAQVEGIETARFNPMDWLQDSGVDLAENCMILADAIVIPSNGNEPFWKDEAKAYIVGVIGYVATGHDEEGQRHLGRVRDLFLLDGDGLQELLNKMM